MLRSLLFWVVDPDYQEEIDLVPENVNKKDYFLEARGSSVITHLTIISDSGSERKTTPTNKRKEPTKFQTFRSQTS